MHSKTAQFTVVTALAMLLAVIVSYVLNRLGY
jgi:hypothetical protein